MKAFVTGSMFAGLIIAAGCSQNATQPASEGPNGHMPGGSGHMPGGPEHGPGHQDGRGQR